jgi:hypothetical protein
MRRPILLAIALGIAAMAFPSLSRADAPVREQVITGSFLLEGSCAFPVQVEPSHDKGTLLTFSDGRQVFGGSYLATATNVDSGKSISVNLSGQFMFDPATGVFSTTGTTILADQGALTLVHGPIIFDAQGRTIISSSVTDLCAVLSDP